MGRIDAELLERIEDFCHRCLDVVDVLEKQNRSRRITDQLTGSSTSIGANMFEADESLSRKDFAKCVAISIKELNDTHFWLRLIARRDWISIDRLGASFDEANQIKKILGPILSRTRSAATVRA